MLSINNQFAKRTNWDLRSNELSKIIDTYKNEDVDIIDLTVSNPTKAGFDFYNSQLIEGLSSEKVLSYSPKPKGMVSAREAVATYYQQSGFDVDASEVFLTSSTSEAYTYLFRLLANPKDAILMPRPSYPLFSFLCDINDIQEKTYSLDYSDRWEMNADDIVTKINDQIKAIVMVNPNNPTGSYCKVDELEFLSMVSEDRKVPLISDEVFWDFHLKEDSQRKSLLEKSNYLSFTLGGLSKCLGLPQMKLSWIIIKGDKNTVKEATERLEIIADTYLSVNSISQVMLPQWLSMRKVAQVEIMARLKENYESLKDTVEHMDDFNVLRPEGGWYAILKLPNTICDEQCVLRLLREHQLLVHPGFYYDFQEGNHLILSLLTPKETFNHGISLISKTIKQMA